MEKDRYDDQQHFWCPMLGQPMTFAYCRKMREGKPCHRVVACFSPHFDVEAYLKEQYGEEEVKQILAPASGRMEKIMDTLAGETGKKGD
ncbi:hypothetical protein [Dethiosulfatarculus sandiegensis]|uniref:Uncharacterized protein n=1 Tax=Dethiosulfatarculus sandiegensis TaxID=1429043 RepID=A0A0D2JQY5_9BACT|nr:hypothetical protein [Dethiosulfatarculus sandiegensis]KIX11905.1 hypothetical protein X474_21915 [Dethiosulfatarculus sandiegensis]